MLPRVASGAWLNVPVESVKQNDASLVILLQLCFDEAAQLENCQTPDACGRISAAHDRQVLSETNQVLVLSRSPCCCNSAGFVAIEQLLF